MKTYILFILASALLFSGCISQEPPAVEPPPADSEINSFDECAAAGYPIMESYPAQCRVPGGPSFTQVLTDEECQKQDVEHCLAGCVVCPPCPECSSISCRSEEFCASIGFDRSWHESMGIK